MTQRVITVGELRWSVTESRWLWWWEKIERGEWEPETVWAIREILGPGTTFIDVGAFIGPTTMIAAARGASVLALEPDPVAVAELRTNLLLNPDLSDRVSVSEVALSDDGGRRSLLAGRYTGLGGGTSSLIAGSMTAETSVGIASESVEALASRPEFGRCNLIKIDIEGYEHVLAPKIAQLESLPPMLLSVHSLPFGDKALKLPWGMGATVRRVAYAESWVRSLRPLLRRYRYRYIEKKRAPFWTPLTLGTVVTVLGRFRNVSLFLTNERPPQLKG